MKNDAKALQAHSRRAEFSGNTTNFHEEIQGEAQIKHKNRSKAQTKIFVAVFIGCMALIAAVIWALQTAFGFLNQDLKTGDNTLDMLTSKEQYEREAPPVKESTQYIISHIDHRDSSLSSGETAGDYRGSSVSDTANQSEDSPNWEEGQSSSRPAPIIEGIPTGRGNAGIGNTGSTQAVTVIPGGTNNTTVITPDRPKQEETPGAVGQEGRFGPNSGVGTNPVQPNFMQFGTNRSNPQEPGQNFVAGYNGNGGNFGGSGYSVSASDNGERPLTLAQRQRQSPMMGGNGNNNRATEEYGEDGEPRNGKADDLTKNLAPVQLDEGSATRLRNRSYLLPQGTFITCILETAVNTTVPGLTTCRIPKDVYSLDGKTLLIERGSRALGEYKGAIAQGQARVFVLWTKIETPHGVMIQLDSPGADTLGRSGLAGAVDYHWWERFGNALLFSLIDDGFRLGMSSMQEGDNNTYTTTDSSIGSLLQEVMRTSGQIPPTILVNQGARIGIMTARSVDMSNVYRLTKKVSN